jgi:hypothetical protein
MSDQAEQLRQLSADCLVLAKKAVNSEVRVGLITMAQQLYALADSEPGRLHRLSHALSIFNDDQMSRH